MQRRAPRREARLHAADRELDYALRSFIAGNYHHIASDQLARESSRDQTRRRQRRSRMCNSNPRRQSLT